MFKETDEIKRIKTVLEEWKETYQPLQDNSDLELKRMQALETALNHWMINYGEKLSLQDQVNK